MTHPDAAFEPPVPPRQPTQGKPGTPEQPGPSQPGPGLANQLAGQTSPYLLQHAGNPVAWHPWGPEAFARARHEDKPVFLSVGYSTCYWCHVMERESFEDDEVAALLNDEFVSIKVDREERPDIDQQYMLVSQWITGRGGWPNSVWLTPDGKPWMAGNYFPRGQFLEMLRALGDAWKTRRREVEQQAERLVDAVRRASSEEIPPSDGRRPDRSWIDRAVAAMRRSFDTQDAGFGRAPKFPPHDRLALLADECAHGAAGDAPTMFTATLDAMAAGGIRDHLGGGFHRYSTDGQWLVPHFEKMLYDNALLLRAYADGYCLTGNEDYRDVADGIVAWLVREMIDPAGGFHSALDAETQHEEGKFYVWTHREILDALGPRDGQWFASLYGVMPQGNYIEHPSGRRTGANILHRPRPTSRRNAAGDWSVFRQVESVSRLVKSGNTDLPPSCPEEESASRLAACRAALLDVRNARTRPHLDDKVLAGWNGLMIGGLAHAAGPLGRPQWIDLAARAADFLIDCMTTADGGLLHTYRAGRAHLPGYLDDYAYTAAALVDLHIATGAARWLEAARRLMAAMFAKFLDRVGGGFFFTSADHEDLLAKSKNLVDGSNTPSANAVAIETLLRLARLDPALAEYRRIAESSLAALSGFLWQYPEGTESFMPALAMSLRDMPPAEEVSPAALDRCAAPHLVVELVTSSRTAARGSTLQAAVVFEVEPGWHLYGPRSDPTRVLPARVALRPNAAFEQIAAIAPEGRTAFDPRLQSTMELYEGRIVFRLSVHVASGAALGTTMLAVDVSAAVCGSQECSPPLRATLSTSIVVTPASEPALAREPASF